MYKIIVFEYIRLCNILQHENGLNIADDIVFYKGITGQNIKVKHFYFLHRRFCIYEYVPNTVNAAY
jgi:hypothetical protein